MRCIFKVSYMFSYVTNKLKKNKHIVLKYSTIKLKKFNTIINQNKVWRKNKMVK
jgi:hypothetical protein